MTEQGQHGEKWHKEGPSFLNGFEEWFIQNAQGFTVATCYDEVDADQIILDHQLAALAREERAAYPSGHSTDPNKDDWLRRYDALTDYEQPRMET